MNKKGMDKIISIYWFAILFIVAATIVYMVVVFYGKPYDVRELEANALINKVADCLSSAGVLTDADCNLNFETEDFKDWKDNGQYYVNATKIPWTVFQVGGSAGESLINEGNVLLKEMCFLNNEEKKNSLPVCVERSFYAVEGSGKDQKKFVIKILAVVNKADKNV